MRRIIAISILAALAVGSMPASAHHPHKRTQDYIGSYDPISPRVCEANENRGINIGGACFTIPHSGSRTVTIEVVDTVNSLPGFYYRFYNEDGTCNEPDADGLGCDSAGFGCPTATNLPISPGAVGIEVLVSGVVLGPLNCNNQGQVSPGAATVGTITATFNR